MIPTELPQHDETAVAPVYLPGGSHVDSRGIISFVNSFAFDRVRRFYCIRWHNPPIPRGWVGHRRELKWFTVVSGAALIAVVQPDDWENPSPDLPVHRFVLSHDRPGVLFVPAGHATAATALTADPVLIVFSSGGIEDAASDDYRFESTRWSIRSSPLE